MTTERGPDELVRVLSEHYTWQLVGHPGDGWACTCGEHLSPFWPKAGVRPRETALDVALRNHLGAVLAARDDRLRSRALGEAADLLHKEARYQGELAVRERPATHRRAAAEAVRDRMLMHERILRERS